MASETNTNTTAKTSETSPSSNWSERVEDLIESGDMNTAISFLETLTSNLQNTINTSPSPSPSPSPSSSQQQQQLSSALFELSKLYSSKGLSLKSDHTLSLATSISISISLRRDYNNNTSPDIEDSRAATSSIVPKAKNDDNVANNDDEASEDDWETLADREPDELLAPQSLPQVSKLSLEEPKETPPKRRGRGTFAYKKKGLYSDDLADGHMDELPDEAIDDEAEKSDRNKSMYGTHHVLVLDGFDPSTTTTDLERLFEEFKDGGCSIRWVNDTLALAVFRNSSIAMEACNSVHCSFSLRVLEEEDPVMTSISFKDLDPPRQRPKTSARTAQRLIAQELGVKLPSAFGSRELKKQEDARKNRIITRQNLRDEAWGPD